MTRTSKRVLILDADAVFRRQLTIWLQPLGFQGIQAGTAMEGMHRLQRERDFAVLLLDLQLPDISGHALLDVLQQRHARMPVIVLGRDSSTDDVIKAFRRKAADFLPKPFDDKALHAAFQRIGLIAEQSSKVGASVGADRRSATTGSLLRPAFRKLRAELARGDVRFPVLDPKVPKLQALAGGSPGVEEVVELIGRDPALAGNVVRMANSAFYKRGGDATNLHEACVRLGTSRAVTIALEALTRNSFQAKNRKFRAVLESMWRNAVVTSRFAEILAKRGGYRDPSEARIAALFHNIGETLLVQLIADIPDSTHFTLEDVAKNVEKTHEDFGRALAVAWGLPQMFVVLAGYHHKPRTSPEPPDERNLRLLTVIAWKLALQAGFTYFPDQEDADPEAEIDAMKVLPRAIGPELVEQAQEWEL